MVRVRNPQDFWAGILFIVFGGLALWFGRSYAIGTLSKIGPGFLPVALSIALLGIGAILLLRALAVDGPGDREEPDGAAALHPGGDRRVRSTIERLGLALTVARGRRHGVVRRRSMHVVRDHRARGRALGAVRRAVRRTARSAVHGLAVVMDIFANLATGFGARRDADQSRLLPVRLPGRHPDRRAARHRTDRHHRDAAADDVRPEPARRADHAGRHLLRRAVWRLDHGDPGQPAGRSRRRSSPASTATRWRGSGRAGAALTVAAVGSFFAGCVGTLLIAAFAPVLAAFAVKFRSPEYFALMLFGLIAAVILAHGSVIKAVGMVLLGLLVGLVGTDSQTATCALHLRRAGARTTASISCRSPWGCSASPRS